MRDFVLPFKPEELLAQPADDRLWASDLPPVDEWSQPQASKALDGLAGRLLKSKGKDLASDESFSLVFALLQGWPRLEEDIRPRVGELLADAARRLIAEVSALKKSAKSKEQDAARDVRNACKVAAFFLKWGIDRVLTSAQEAASGINRRGKGRGRGASNPEKDAAAEEAKEAQKASEKLRCSMLLELAHLIGKDSMPWMWMHDPAAWQSVAAAVSDAGFVILGCSEVMKHRESRNLSLRCIAEPLLQEGHQHSNLLVATVSKLMHGLRGGETGAPFAADCLLLAHTTPLPRLFLVELPQHCNAGELSSQGGFQRALAQFLVALTERLPHVVLANISVLLPLLDVDCYPLRSALVESIGALLAAEGRKLPSGAHCEVPVPEVEGAEGEAAEGGEEVAPEAVQEIRKDKNAPVVHFSIANATKKDLLETLLTRSLDKSVWVRYRVLQTLQSLASNTRVVALPRSQWSRVLDIATRRMQDSASMSRKAAMQLVRTLIEFHPYGPALQGSGDERAKAQKLLEEVAARFRKLQDDEAAEAEETLAAVRAGEAGEDGQAQKRRRIKKKTVTDQTVEKDIADALADEDECEDPEAERKRQRDALLRMRDCYSQRLHFVELIDSAESRLRGLLASRTNTDVTEAIQVVVELRLKGVPAATKAFDQVLGLVWSRHLPIKDAAVEAFNRMHLEGRDAKTAVRSLLEMYEKGCAGGSWTYTHLASVQELIQLSAEKEFIDPKAAIPELMAALPTSACPMALRALTALAAACAQRLATELPRLAELMGPRGPAAGRTPADVLERVRLLCQLLQCIYNHHKGPLDAGSWKCLWSLCQHSICLLVESFARDAVPSAWFGACQAAMDLSFELAFSPQADVSTQQCPDKLWEQLLARMLGSVLDRTNSGPAAVPICDASGAEEAKEGAGEGAPEVSEQASYVEKVGSARVGCIVFVAGHLALRMLVYLETLQGALKKKRMAEEDKRTEAQRDAQKKKPKKGKKGAKEEEEEDKEGAEASMGMAGQEEREAEEFAEIAEHSLLFSSRSLLDRVKPLIFACLLDPTLRTDPLLRRLGAISLCKYMTVSKKFCEGNLQLLFTVLFPKSKESGALSFTQCADAAEGAARASSMGPLTEDLTLRQSLLVAVGDLLFRHPNVVEPWTGRLYAALGASGAGGAEPAQVSELRLTALLVLTHLVLNDMMKPRAVLLVRALWLTACTHEATARVSRILFQELSKRSNNVIYNLLPEIIARMPEHQSSAGHVTGGPEARVQYVMQFVDKEKHIEGLIEKIAIRLEQAANVVGGKAAGAKGKKPPAAAAHNEDGEDDEGAAPAPTQAKATVSCLAHALSGMNYTDRCVLRLHDAVVTRKAVHTAISYHDVVRECLLNIVDKCRKAKAAPKAGDGAGPPPEMDAAAAAPAEGGAGGKAGASAAAMAALDAIESTVNGLAKGKDDKADLPAAAAAAAAEGDTPAAAPKAAKGRGNVAAKRKAAEEEEDVEPGFEAERKTGKGKGRGRGRGAGDKAAAGRGAGKKRKARDQEDDEDFEP